MAATTADTRPALVVTPDDAARLLAISRAKLYNLLADGALPSHRIGRSRRIRVADLDAYLDTTRVSL